MTPHQMIDRLLEISVQHERWGCSAQDFADQAIPLLRAAGLDELADRLEDDPWGDDTALLLSQLRIWVALHPRR